MLKFYSLRKVSLICFTFKKRRVSNIIQKMPFVISRTRMNAIVMKEMPVFGLIKVGNIAMVEVMTPIMIPVRSKLVYSLINSFNISVLLNPTAFSKAISFRRSRILRIRMTPKPTVPINKPKAPITRKIDR